MMNGRQRGSLKTLQAEDEMKATSWTYTTRRGKMWRIYQHPKGWFADRIKKNGRMMKFGQKNVPQDGYSTDLSKLYSTLEDEMDPELRSLIDQALAILEYRHRHGDDQNDENPDLYAELKSYMEAN